MRVFKSLMCTVLSFVVAMSFCTVAFATGAAAGNATGTTSGTTSGTITIDKVSIQEFQDQTGTVKDELVNIVVEFTITNPSEEFTVLLTSEEVTGSTKEPETKIIYINQEVTPTITTYTFVAEKAKIKEATGLTDIEGCTLYLKMGAMGIYESDMTTFTYRDPKVAVIYGDVTGDKLVNIGDAIRILRYNAKLDTLNAQ